MVKSSKSGVSGGRFTAKVPKTPLSGTEKQVQWAESIRDGMTNTIAAYYISHKVELEERIAKYEESGRRPRLVEKYKNELSTLSEEVSTVNSALSGPSEASWFIDHRGFTLDDVPTRSSIEGPQHAGQRNAIRNVYDGLRGILTESGDLTGKYERRQRMRQFL